MQIQISDKITLMLSEQGFTYSNWLYINDDVQAVIETGMDAGGLQGVDPEGIDLVVCSHHHFDHCRGNGLFKNADILIHELEADIMQSGSLYIHANSLDMWEELMPGIDIVEATGAIGVSGNPQDINGARNVVPIREGQVLDFGTVKAHVLHTPGHSAGHCCFWFPEADFLFSSDICLTKVGPWYGEHLASPDVLCRSIDRLMEIAPKRMVSSHINEVVTDSVPRLAEFKSRIFKREKRIYEYLGKHPSDIHGLAAQNLIYRLHPTNYVLFWEKLMLLKHLARLEADNLVQNNGGVYEALA